MDKPGWYPIWLRCSACQHDWDDWSPVMVPVATLVAHWKSYRCPNCGRRGRNILLRLKPIGERDGEPAA